MQQEPVYLGKSGRLCKAACLLSVPTWKRYIAKLLQAAQGFFLRGGAVWPFLVFERECITLEKQQILLSACFELSKQTWRWPRGMMGSENMDDIMELWPISYERLWACFFGAGCLVCFMNWFSYRFLTGWLWKGSFSPVWTHVCLCGLSLIKDWFAYNMKIVPALVDLASEFFAENVPSGRVGIMWIAIMGKASREDAISILKWNITDFASWDQENLFKEREKLFISL